MAYTKQTWATGDVVTSAKLNHMEDGIANSGVMVLHASQDGDAVTLDKTWQKIYDAFSTGTVIRVFAGNNSNPDDFYVMYDEVSKVSLYNGSYTVSAGPSGRSSQFIASNANDYPAFTISSMT